MKRWFRSWIKELLRPLVLEIRQEAALETLNTPLFINPSAKINGGTDELDSLLPAQNLNQ